MLLKWKHGILTTGSPENSINVFLRSIYLSFVCSVPQSCLTLCDPMDYSPPGSSVPGIFQARILEWVAISFFRVSPWPKDRTHGSPALKADALLSQLLGKTLSTTFLKDLISSQLLAGKIPWRNLFVLDDLCLQIILHMEREVGGGFRIGNMCTPMVDLCQYMAKPIQYCKVK